ncbi:hypothetical protein F383_36676 [Gossypium arboreum]|uniref:Uncharacterized protein n=1 Tax=Gossypium arboreum TaxID=29729 RepID=A0A0B0MAJ8_GOSAR|nr:hypothetical protein F383_36676 [Gossypium arboreum]
MALCLEYDISEKVSTKF